MFRVPATAKGYEFITQMRNTLNKDSYKMRTLFTGKRPRGTTQATTLKKNAESIRVYIDSLIEDGTNPRINDIYENGITTGKARERVANEQRFQKSIDYTKKLLDEIITLKKDLDTKESHFKLEVTSNNMKREKIAELEKRIDNEVCEGSCVSHEDYEGILKDNIYKTEKMDGMREEIIALNKSLATAHGDIVTYTKLLSKEMDTNKKLEENIDAKSKFVSRTNYDIDLARIVDVGFNKWIEQQPWHKRWFYKLGTIAWRDIAVILFALWTIPMIILLTLKVEGLL